tara:strand:- start:2328 stop:3428 length:1101 start_codon:yes stop_codon:yes gene_type:complete
MKIKNFNSVEKEHFKKSAADYLDFYKEVTSKLSSYSHAMYSRALSYIAVENGLYNHTPKELAVALSKDILTTTDFKKIVGTDSDANQNIRLAAFRNLIEPYKEELKTEISSISYETMVKLLSRKGGHIRKTLTENKPTKTPEQLLQKRSWKDLQNVVKNMNKEYNKIVNTFLKTNEIPDYVTLRNILIGNLYMFNSHEHNGLKTHVLLRNEYRNAYVWINDTSPPQDKNNYFWINFETQKHYFVVQKSKTQTSQCNTQRRLFILSPNIVNMIIFIKQTFNENVDKPFFKNNRRDAPPHNTEWIRLVGKIFEEVGANINCSVIRMIYQNEIDWTKLNQEQISYVANNLDTGVKNCGIPPDNQALLVF